MAGLDDNLQSDGTGEPGTILDQNQGVIFDDDNEIGAELDTANESTQDDAEAAAAAQEEADKAAEAEAKKKEDEEEKNLPDYAKRKIDKKHFEKKQAERRAEELEAENRALKAQASGSQQADIEPVIPEIPKDPWDTGYTEVIEAREKAIAEHAKWEVRRNNSFEQQKSKIEQARVKAVENQQKIVDNYAAKVVKSGFDKAVINENEKVVAAYIVNQEFRNIILQDDKAPNIISYLGSNVDELDAMSKMTFAEATRHLYSKVLPNAQKQKPISGKAAPPKNYSGGRQIPDKKDPALTGTVFE